MTIRLLDNRGASIVETTLVIIIISILAVVVVDRYETIAEEAKKVALKTELNTLRQAIQFFQIKNGRNPENLKELISKSFVMPYKDTVITAKYLEHYTFDKNKNLLDPFGMPFAYDPATGRVWSTKQGFEGW